MSVKTTQKEIKSSDAEDITLADAETIKAIKEREGGLDEIAWSAGLYGLNGYLLQGRESGRLYKITARTGALYLI